MVASLRLESPLPSAYYSHHFFPVSTSNNRTTSQLDWSRCHYQRRPPTCSLVVQKFPVKSSSVVLYASSGGSTAPADDETMEPPSSPPESSKDRRKVVQVAWEKLVRWSRSWRSKAKTDVLERANKVVIFHFYAFFLFIFCKLDVKRICLQSHVRVFFAQCGWKFTCSLFIDSFFEIVLSCLVDKRTLSINVAPLLIEIFGYGKKFLTAIYL